jgi:putative ribosome biogenesis GTPase RsgA
MPPILSSLRKPDAAALFTDRVDERALIDKILAPIPTTELGQNHAITVFYGISGSGKSSLCKSGDIINLRCA